MQHNLFQSCASANSRFMEECSADSFEPLYYAANNSEEDPMKVPLLADELKLPKSHSLTPRFYEIRSVLVGNDMDKEVCC